MPKEAEETSEEGAEAFARHYMEVFNALSQDPQAGTLTDLSRDGCQTCEAFQGSLNDMAEEGQRAEGPVVDVLDATAVATDEQADVSLDVRELGPPIVDADGETVMEAEEPAESQLVLILERGPGGWEVAEIQASAS
jgi:hypothetical protein